MLFLNLGHSWVLILFDYSDKQRGVLSIKAYIKNGKGLNKPAQHHFPYVMMFVLMLRGLTLPGALHGLPVSTNLTSHRPTSS